MTTDVSSFYVNGYWLFVLTFLDGEVVKTQIAYVHPEKGFVFRDSEENGGGEE